MRRDSSVGIATGYGLEGARSIPGNARVFLFSVKLTTDIHLLHLLHHTSSCRDDYLIKCLENYITFTFYP
jgi:hypothetical protein